MEISVLQSLIDRTSNQIASLEISLEYWSSGLEERQNVPLKFYKKEIAKLVKIQKALKKEIDKAIKKAAQQRFYDSM